MSENNVSSGMTTLSVPTVTASNIVRFPVEKTRLPGESVENYVERRKSFRSMEDIFQELCDRLNELEEEDQQC